MLSMVCERWYESRDVIWTLRVLLNPSSQATALTGSKYIRALAAVRLFGKTCFFFFLIQPKC